MAGDAGPLYAILERASRLPGTKPNIEYAKTFAASLGPDAESLAVSLATIDADYARGGTAAEFIPMCGVLAVGDLARAEADDRKRAHLLAVLHDAAEDLRFRVREMVPLALVRIGERHASLVGDLEPWMDGYFHAAAVL